MFFRKIYLIGISAFFCSLPFVTLAASDSQKCVQIYYDLAAAKEKNYYLGRVYTISLQNLVSHFVDIQPYISPIEYYQPGQINRCFATIYLGTYENNKVPKSFIEDFVKTKANVMWINNNISQLGDGNLKKIWGAQYFGIAGLDFDKKEPNGTPGSYKNFTYKGEVFSGELSAAILKENFYARDINVLYLPDLDRQRSEVISWAKHSTRLAQTPYILRQKNHWYVAANPFSYMGRNKYLVFADILFDFLDEQPVDGGKKYALVRIEDVHPKTNQKAIRIISNLFAKNKIPFSMALIPVYKDPLGIYARGFKVENSIKENYGFSRALKDAEEKNASFIWHGVTHQYDSTKNPYSGVSAEDYEFWYDKTNQPIAEDSPEYVLNLLKTGFSILKDEHINPVAWLTPHYAASPLDYTIFGLLFPWNVGAVRYSLTTSCIPEAKNEQISLDDLGGKTTVNLKVKSLNNYYYNSSAPYVVFRDYFGQRLIPDYLGHLMPIVKEGVVEINNPDDIIANAKKFLVLRDVWASFAFHTIMLNTPDKGGIAKRSGDTDKLQRIISALKDDGYTFVDLKTWTKLHESYRALKPIEVGPFAERCN